jgi:hypothetical protein
VPYISVGRPRLGLLLLLLSLLLLLLWGLPLLLA